MSVDRAACVALDAVDELAAIREKFLLPDDAIYLDGNSLGALPAAVPGELAGLVTQEWGRDLISGWNRHSWIDLPRVVGEKIAPLLGSAPGEVIAADSTSVNLFKLLSAGLLLVPGRTDIVSVADNFPTDLYMAQGLSELLGTYCCRLRLTSADRLMAAFDEQRAVVLLTHVDFRSGRLFDLTAVTRQAHDAGAVTLWDLAHSAGALPLDLDAAGVDLAMRALSVALDV